MSISGTTMNVQKLTVGGVDVKDAMSKRTLTFTFPEQHITSSITLDFQNCVFSHVDDNPEFDIVVIDAEDKVICGKRK